MGVVKDLAHIATFGLFFGDEEPQPKAPPDPNVERQQAEAEAARKTEEEKRKRSKFGRESTFATSPFGIKEQPGTAKRTLLGA